MSLFPEHYPEEYIDGKITFFGRDFIVTPDVLIPRLETEGLVRRARNILKQRMDENSEMGFGGGKIKAQNGETEVDKLSELDESNILMSEANEFLSPSGAFGTLGSGKVHEKIIVIDIGCGSGIIGTSVADLADEMIFLDISSEALRVAEQNFRTHFPDKKAQFIVSDLLSVFLDGSIQLRHHPATPLFLTNLPYIKDEDWQNMSADTVHEPKLALFGGEETGFELYEKLFRQLSQLPSILGEGLGVRWSCLYEFGFDQREVAEEVVKKYPQWEYSFFADYAGIERFGEIHV